MKRSYKVDFKNILTGKRLTVTLTQSKEESKKKLKTIAKRFSFLWRQSVIYC